MQKEGIYKIAFSHDSKQLASLGKTISLWNLTTYKITRIIELEKNTFINGIIFHINGNVIKMSSSNPWCYHAESNKFAEVTQSHFFKVGNIKGWKTDNYPEKLSSISKAILRYREYEKTNYFNYNW